MHYTVEAFPHDNYLEISLKGDVLKDTDAEKIQNLIIDYLREYKTKCNAVLIDMRELGRRASITSTFFRTGLVPNDVKYIRVAFLDLMLPQSTIKVAETMYRNKGINVKLFYDYN